MDYMIAGSTTDGNSISDAVVANAGEALRPVYCFVSTIRPLNVAS
jgi:hypothetical protein